MRHSLVFIGVALTTFLTLVVVAPPLQAAPFSSAVMQRCVGAVGQMKFDGWPADRNREMMMLACQANGGTVPGSHD